MVITMTSTQPPDFPALLISAREAAGLSQRQTDTSTGIDQARLSRLENGHATPTVHELRLLAAAYEVAIESLIPPLATASAADDQTVA